MIQRRDLLKKSAAVLASAPVLTVGAQSYPSRPVRLIVGFAPGGANDILARVYATKMQNVLQQPVVVENKPGANSIIAAEYVAKSAPDGYTLLVASNGLMTINPAIYPRLNYDPARDFDVIGAFAYYPYVVISKAGAGLDDIASLRAAAATRELTHGVGSSVFQLTSEYLARQSGMKILHVPYRGSAPVITAVLSGEVDFAIVDIGSALPFVQSGRIKAIAVTSPTSSAVLPSVPPIGAVGNPPKPFQVTAWTCLATPSKLDPAAATRLRAALQAATADPDTGSQLQRLGMDPGALADAALLRRIRDERTQWTQLAQAAGIKAE
jgi:tripartite-type tricarboxylate transporter receptor subunit TctC